jgi:predicted glycosyltransferase
MRVLIDLKHPADVLLFRDVAHLLMQRGHRVLLTSRQKDETVDLLDGLGMRHRCISIMGSGVAGMGGELLQRVARLYAVAREFQPDVLAARAGVCVAWVGKLLNLPTVDVEDTEFAWLQIALSTPLASVVCTGLGYRRRFPGKELSFRAPPQLAYTHPSRFRPDPNVLRYRGLDPQEPYILIRLKAWRAMHDLGTEGPQTREVVSLVGQLHDCGRPVISTERPLPAELARYVTSVPPEDGLSLLAFARIYVGEGSSMAAEAACLGTPAVFISPRSRRGYLDAMERLYGHVTTVQAPWQALAVARKWLRYGDPQAEGADARRRLLADCEDPAPFLADVIERYGMRRRASRAKWENR